MTEDKWYDWQHLVNTYKSLVNDRKLVVEIGSSTVSRTVELARYCKRLIGIEKLKERIPVDKRLLSYGTEIINADWQNLSKVISPNTADIIIASHVIEHVVDDVKCLNESYKVLKKGGYLLFNTPNRKRLSRDIIEIFAGERKFPFLEHVREYIRKDLESLIDRSYFSFKDAKITGIAFGIHINGLRLYINKAPRIFDKLSTYWEVLLQK